MLVYSAGNEKYEGQIMGYWLLFTVFFKVGLFTIGGGLASVGLLHDYLVLSGYLSATDFYNMFAISQSTPGPIGINMATFVGFKYGGIAGASLATFALVLPSLVIITILVYSLKKAGNNKYIEGIFLGCRPAAIGIIATVAYYVSAHSVFSYSGVQIWQYDSVIKFLLFAMTLVLAIRYSLHPILCIITGGVAALIFL